MKTISICAFLILIQHSYAQEELLGFDCTHGDLISDFPKIEEINENVSKFSLTLYEKTEGSILPFAKQYMKSHLEKLVINGMQCVGGLTGTKFSGLRGAKMGSSIGKEMGQFFCKYYDTGDFEKAIKAQMMGHLPITVRDAATLGSMIYDGKSYEEIERSVQDMAIRRIPSKQLKDLATSTVEYYRGQDLDDVAANFLIKKAKDQLNTTLNKGEGELRRMLDFKLCVKTGK